MSKVVKSHKVNDTIAVYQQDNAKRWYARIKINGQWLVRATGKTNKDEAIIEAAKIQSKFETLVEHGYAVKKRLTKKKTFNAVAELAIKRMEDANENGIGKVVFADYIAAINKYHIPFFGKMNIKDVIEAKTQLELDEWRINLLGRVPAKSTILTHNAAMQRVLDEAVMQKYITASELPILKNTGEIGKRRGAFTQSEYNQILEKAKEWIDEGAKQVTRDIRERLYYYIQVAALTGMRIGTEMDNLTWEDIVFNANEKNKKSYLMFNVRKGKTTKYTGTREIIAKKKLVLVVEAMALNLRKGNKWNYTDKVFGKTSEFIANFNKILNSLNLKANARGVRTLYSLRHSYITWELEKGTGLRKIADQCGTSEQMIEQHYKHTNPMMFAEELSS